MRNGPVGIIGGFDCHTDVHVGATLDSLGRLLGTESFAATPAGYRKARAWLASFGRVIAVGVESTGSFGAALTRFLSDHGLRVIEVNQAHPLTKARRGKSDPIDAEAAARKVLSGEAAGAAKDSTGVVEAIRQLTVARDGAVKARSAALCQFGDLLVTAPAPVREQLSGRKTLALRAALCARMRPDPSRLSDPATAAKFALRSVARRIAALAEEIAQLGSQLEELIALAAPVTRRRMGLGTHNTAALLYRGW
jgi:transposase